MRRAVLVVIAVVALLALLGAPFLSIVRFPGRPGAAGVGHLARGAAGDPRRLQAEPVGVSTVVVTGANDPNSFALRSHSQDLSRVKGVDAVTSSAGLFVQSAQVAEGIRPTPPRASRSSPCPRRWNRRATRPRSWSGHCAPSSFPTG